MVFDFIRDVFEEPVSQVAGCHQHPLVLFFDGVTGELIEQPGELFPHLLVCGEVSIIFIDATGLWVVVSCSDMRVVTQGPVIFLSDDQGQLAVGFQAHQSIDHVNAGLLELFGPRDVGLFIKSGFDFDQCEN